MSLVIGHATIAWSANKDDDGTIKVNVTVSDRFDFDEKEYPNFRSFTGNSLTSLGRDGELKEADITGTFTLEFKRTNEGKYDYTQ